MIRWIKTRFFKTDKLKNEHDIGATIASMLDFLVNKVTSSEEVESLNRKTKKYTARPLKEQIAQLPSFYLFLEQYLTEYNRSGKYSRRVLRNTIQRDFRQIAELENCRLIFEAADRQEVLLARLFLVKMSERAYTFLGASGENLLISLKNWLQQVPDAAHVPVPLLPKEELPKTYAEWAGLLTKISHTIFFEVESRFNEDFARSFYDATYNEIAANYKGLENFPTIINLLPNKLLDEEKINLLSKQQLNGMLLDKVDFLQKINEEVTEKNREIKSQKELLEEERKKLEDAQQIIKEQNEKLLQANLLLEDKVEERTNQLNSAFQKLLQANKELDLFVYRTAHDLKGPIARFLGLCQLAQYEEEKPHLPDYILKLENSAVEMNNILSLLLRTSKITNREVEESGFSVASLVFEVWEELRESLDVSGIRLKVDIPKEFVLIADLYLLKILFTNLLTNAIQYRDPEKKDAFIHVLAEEDPASGTVILIKDNGIGIDSALESNIFDMFFKGTLLSKGFGLGLYEARCIINKLKGEIKLEGSGQGVTAFKIVLSPNSRQLPNELPNAMVS